MSEERIDFPRRRNWTTSATFAPQSAELREDGTLELREDGSFELREGGN